MTSQPETLILQLDQIRESKTNPRQAFDKGKLQELADSIAAHGVLQPVLVRRLAGKPHYELVAGARRFRASKLAKQAAIAAVVRDLTDKEVLEIQVIENLQREDLHPLEEADGYRTLIDKHGYTADELAAKVGKSKASVYARLKLCELSKGARKLFLAGKLDASRALLIARIPVAGLQDEAAKTITQENRWSDGMSCREAQEYLQEHYMLRLPDAPFNPKDADLVKDAGACAACPKMTGNQPELFGDVKRGDVCTDPTCFDAKKKAHFDVLRAKAQAQGRPILEGKEAERVLHSGHHVDLSSQCFDDPKYRTFRTLLKGEDVERTRVIERDKVIELVDKRQALAAIRKGGKHRLRSSTGRSQSPRETAEMKRHKRRMVVVRDTVEDLVAKAEKSKDSKAFLRVVVEAILARSFYETTKAVGQRREQKSLERCMGAPTPASTKILERMSEGQLRGLILELVAMNEPSPRWHGGGYGYGWKSVCKLLRIDYLARERKLARQDAAKKGRRSKTRAKRKAPAKRRSGTPVKRRKQKAKRKKR